MADKTISELTAAQAVGSSDLFVLEQNNTAKKLTGQILENWLVSFADGHGGIQSIAKTGSTGTNPVVDTYTITLADTTTYTFTVTNGLKGATGAQTYVHIKWAAQQPTANNQMSNTPDAWIGIATSTSSTAPSSYTSYKWYQYKGDKGDTGDGVTDVTRTSGTGSPGTTDTYTVYAGSPGVAIGTFNVYNGSDGEGSPGTQTPLVDSSSGVIGTANAYSREDHQHPLNVATSGTPAALGTAARGVATTYARFDHVHQMPTPANVGAAPAIHTGSITMNTSWTEQTSDWTKTVTVTGATITSASKVDLQPSTTAIAQMINDGVSALYIENNSGTLTAHAVGAAPTASMTIQCTVTEVS